VRQRIFLLSPASTGGERAKLLFNPAASFSLATRLREPEGASLGDTFSFLSGLYFRGKLTYARAFARPSGQAPGILVITPNRGLASPDLPVTLRTLRSFARVDIATQDARYRRPLVRDAKRLAGEIGSDCDVVLLGSIATGKYVDSLLTVFGDRLCFPAEFVGRGDMSRGGLLLRHARAGQELTYISVAGATRHGVRPAKLEKIRGAAHAAIGETTPPAYEQSHHS
jgi:hypothetical protein